MKKCMKFLALALAAVLTFSLAGNVKAAEKFEPGYTNLEELNAEIDYDLDAEVKAQLADIVKDSVTSLDKADEADPAKSTFVAFRYSPLKVVKYDGEAHGMKANAYKTIGGAYVGKAEILYVGMTADGTVYNSFDKPVEVGFYYAVAMFAGNDNNYPSVGYGVLVIMPVCTCPDPECPVPECPNKPNVPDTPDVPGTPDCPHWPDCPDWPNCPDKPDCPDKPNTPDVPDTPDTPDVPDTPDTPDVPDTPDTPDVPDTPDKPDTPDTPDKPNTPDVPDTPDVPNTPDTPDEEPKAPVTGDSANFMVYVVMMAVAVVAMVAAKRNRA